MDTLDKLQDVFRSVFDDDSIVLARDTTAQDIEAWDSVQHVTLMLEAEERVRHPVHHLGNGLPEERGRLGGPDRP